MAGTMDTEAEIALYGAAHGGEAVGRVGDRVAFIAYGLPGERVLAETLERKPRFLRGRVREVLEPAPERVPPPCPIFGTCGGCHWQHATYGAQLRYKRGVLVDQLIRIGKFLDPPVGESVASPREWHYRNTVQLVSGSLRSDSRPVRAAEGGLPGSRLLCFQRAHSHDPVPVEHCYISDELINRAIHDVPWDALTDTTWRRLDGVTLRAVPGHALQITLTAQEPLRRQDVLRFAQSALRALPEVSGVLEVPARGSLPHVVAGEESLTFAVSGFRLDVPAGSFVQVNLAAVDRLLELVVDWLGPAPADVVVDAYAGVGTFSLPLARLSRAVTAIEADRRAADACAANAASQGLQNVLVQPGAVEHALPRLKSGVDLLVLDPPRRGCAPEALHAVLRLRPGRVAYVSCEPSTLARDLRVLADGGYRLVKSCVVDMFPQTFHLESVSLLEAS
jgi:23S rRNA (uracil1939-C5)-methyltransferase